MTIFWLKSQCEVVKDAFVLLHVAQDRSEDKSTVLIMRPRESHAMSELGCRRRPEKELALAVEIELEGLQLSLSSAHSM